MGKRHLWRHLLPVVVVALVAVACSSGGEPETRDRRTSTNETADKTARSSEADACPKLTAAVKWNNANLERDGRFVFVDLEEFGKKEQACHKDGIAKRTLFTSMEFIASYRESGGLLDSLAVSAADRAELPAVDENGEVLPTPIAVTTGHCTFESCVVFATANDHGIFGAAVFSRIGCFMAVVDPDFGMWWGQAAVGMSGPCNGHASVADYQLDRGAAGIRSGGVGTDWQSMLVEATSEVPTGAPTVDPEPTAQVAGEASNASQPEPEAPEPAEVVELRPNRDCGKTYHVITHGGASAFWLVVEAGVRDAAVVVGCEVMYFGSNNDTQAQLQQIEAAIAAGSDGIAISVANPAGVEAAARAVVAAGIPLYTLNLGVNRYEDLGAVTHIGQTDVVAGNRAGERFNALGATHVLCVRQDQSYIALVERCQGLEETFNGEVTSEFVGVDANPIEQQSIIAALLQGDPSIDGVLGVGTHLPLRALDASAQIGRDLIIGGFDLSSDLVDEIEAGNIAFTVDQQQYLQGYLAVILMHLQATNQNTAGGGLPILSGPGFVDAGNASEIKALMSRGTR